MKRGSITLYLCLTLLVMLSLIFAGLNSARLAAARTVADSIMEQSLFSLFSQYDRDLYDTYGLLLLDGGYGSGSLQMGEILSELEDFANPLITTGNDPLGLKLEECSITGYQMSVDQERAALMNQISEIMIGKLGVSGIQTISSRLSEYCGVSTNQQDQKAGCNLEEMERYYEQAKQGKSEEESTDELTLASTDTDHTDEILEKFSWLKSLGIYSCCVNDSSEISGGTVESGSWVSDRSLEQGMGVLTGGDDSLVDKALLIEFLLDQFPCYTDGAETDKLNYQVEAAIAGKYSDVQNLKTVLDQLILIREASNFLYLLGANSQSETAEELAASISTGLLMPELQPAIALLIKAGWAYGEGLMDLRKLLSGGKVPLVKAEEDWQSGILYFLDFNGSGIDSGQDDDRGISYEWYLRMLLYMKSEAKLADSVVNLLEYHEREEVGKSNFRIDQCITSLEAEMKIGVGNQTISIVRSYGYDM